MNYNNRLQFYLGKNKDIPHPDMNLYSINDLTSNINPFDNHYDIPLKKLLISTNNTDKKFHFYRGDIMNNHEQNNWTLSKNRVYGNNTSVLLRSFVKDRHWKLYYNKPKDILFGKKKNKIFWRGTTTGYSEHFFAKNFNPREVNRFTMIEKWFNKYNNIDVGFSFIHRDFLKNKFKKYVKGICNPEYFLNHKYILSIEGNDKDSGLNWKLNSNSLVLMPKPRVTSWLMETTLIPNFHYVLLKDDFSDLQEKLKWCNNNQDKCKEIIKNANNFMKQFSNDELEKKLEIDVLNNYFKLKNKVN